MMRTDSSKTYYRTQGSVSSTAHVEQCIKHYAPLNILTKPQLFIIEHGIHTSYHKLPEVLIPTITECTDAQSALWQNLVLTNATSEHDTPRLMSTLIKALLGPRPLTVKQVQNLNRHAIKSVGDGDRKSYYGGLRSTECKIIVPIPDKHYQYKLTGSALARYYRDQIEADKLLYARTHTPVMNYLLECTKRISVNPETFLDIKDDGRDVEACKELYNQLANYQFGYRETLAVDQCDRIYGPLTVCKRIMRPVLRLDGEELVALDIKSAHWRILISHAWDNWVVPKQELDDMLDYAIENKQEFYAYLNDVNGWRTKSDLEKIFEDRFPTFYQKFTEHRKVSKSAMYKIYTSKESEIVNALIMHLRSSGYYEDIAGREHDGIRVKKSKAAEMLAVCNQFLSGIEHGILFMKIKTPEIERWEAKEDFMNDDMIFPIKKIQGDLRWLWNNISHDTPTHEVITVLRKANEELNNTDKFESLLAKIAITGWTNLKMFQRKESEE